MGVLKLSWLSNYSFDSPVFLKPASSVKLSEPVPFQWLAEL